jgi:hypothetical protein
MKEFNIKKVSYYSSAFMQQYSDGIRPLQMVRTSDKGSDSASGWLGLLSTHWVLLLLTSVSLQLLTSVSLRLLTSVSLRLQLLFKVRIVHRVSTKGWGERTRKHIPRTHELITPLKYFWEEYESGGLPTLCISLNYCPSCLMQICMV